MPRATYGGASRSMQVYIIERRDRRVGEHRRSRLPLDTRLGDIAKAQFDPRPQHHVDPAFAKVAALSIRTQGGGGGPEDPRLLQHRTGQLAAPWWLGQR